MKSESETIKYLQERVRGSHNIDYDNYGNNWAYYDGKYKSKEELLADFSVPIHKSIKIKKENTRDYLEYIFDNDIKSEYNIRGLIGNLTITSDTSIISRIYLNANADDHCIFSSSNYEIDDILRTNIIPVTRNAIVKLKILGLQDKTIVNIEYDYYKNIDNIDNIEMRFIQYQSSGISDISESKKLELRLNYNNICKKMTIISDADIITNTFLSFKFDDTKILIEVKPESIEKKLCAWHKYDSTTKKYITEKKLSKCYTYNLYDINFSGIDNCHLYFECDKPIITHVSNEQYIRIMGGMIAMKYYK